MTSFVEKWKGFVNNRWLVFVSAMWVQSVAGVGYLFGSISPVIKKTMGYNQRQVAFLGVAKDLGDSVGFLAGYLCEVLPVWALLLIGVVQNFVGYGLVWLIVNQTLPSLPLWVLCVALFIGTNGETYYNTAALISCVQNFPKSRGPVVGILKGFAGLSGAILTQVYLMFNTKSKSSLILLIAVGPCIVVLSQMFIVRPVGGHKQVRPSDNLSFLFTYGVCVALAVYILGILITEDLVDPKHIVITIFALVLIILVLLPIIIPVLLEFFSEPNPINESLFISKPKNTNEESLLAEQLEGRSTQDEEGNEVILSEVHSEIEDERLLDSSESLLPSERHKRIAELQSKLLHAAAEGAVRVKRRKGPRRGENFTLLQALIKADFILIFLSLALGAGSGVTIIDNLGQICESLGYTDTSVFVSMISIWNFLGRVGGGYFSEVVTRKFAYPRPVAIAVFQVIMAIGFLYYALGGLGKIYVVIIMTGLGYGAHWAIVPASVSELFGLKSFGALYNFLTLACPAGSLIFSGVIASGIYDHYAELQRKAQSMFALITLHDDDSSSLTCEGSICYSITCGIMAGFCILAMVLSLIVVFRTKSVYVQLYGNGNP